MPRPLFKLSAFGNPFNTLFGRMMVLMVIMLITDHSVWLFTSGRERSNDHFDQTQRETLLAVSMLQQLDAQTSGAKPDPALQATLHAALEGVRRVGVDSPEAPQDLRGGPEPIPPGNADFRASPIPQHPPDFKPGPIPRGTPLLLLPPPPEMAGLKQHLLRTLPPGSQVVLRRSPIAEVWVLLPHARAWDVIAINEAQPHTPLTSVFIELGMVILFAIIAAWQLQLQKPLAELARAAANFRPYRPPVTVRERGPREVKRVIRHFNETVKELYAIEQDREVMLAGVAHDLRAPITRVRARAEVIPDIRLAGGFIRDADSLTQIVDQFLDFSKLSVDESPPVGVEEFCEAQWGSPESHVERPAEVQLRFQAGPAFMLPVTAIERILSNLVENALSYGAGPVEIHTRRVSEKGGDDTECSDFWELSVRDHGKGIPASQLGMATRPFVRLDVSRSGEAHCGLGLAIVNKLTQRHGGTLNLSNAEGGGLLATLRFAA